MSIIILKRSLWAILLAILTLSPLTHALEEALGTPTTVTSSPISVPIAQADPAKLLEAALQLREAKPALFAGAQGVLIVNVVPGSQAAEKGLQPGDIVIAYAGEKMNSIEQLVEAVQTKASEAQVVLRIIRGEKVEETGLKGGKMGVELKNIQGLQATEFAKQLMVAIQTNDYEKLLQLSRDNPEMAKVVLPPDLLAELGQSIEFEKQLQAAVQAKNEKTIIQLIRDNPKLAKQIFSPELLVEIGQLRPELDRLQEEGEQAYNHSNYPLAIEKWQAGLDQARKLANKRYISLFLSKLGVVYEDLGQYSKALEYLQQALAIHKELGDKRGIGNDLINLGVVYENLSKYSKALEYFQQALAIHKELGDKRGEGIDLTNLGTVYENLSKYPKALEYFQQALAIKRELGDKRGIGNNLGNFGVVYQNLGQYPKALESYQQALAIRREIGDKRGMGDNLGNIGGVYWYLGQYPKALEYFQQALAIHREIGDKYGEGIDLLNLGVVYWILGHYDRAKTHFQDSIIATESLESLDGLWKAQGGLALTEIHLNQPSDAIQGFEQTLGTIEKLRSGITSGIEKYSGTQASDIKTIFMQDKLDVYEVFINLLQTEHQKHPNKGYDRKAIEIFEKKQGRVFLEQMGKSTARRVAGIPEDLSIKDRDLENQVAAARKNLSDAYAKGKELDPSPFRQHLEEVEKAQQAFEEKLKTEYPKYYALKYPQPVKLDDLQQKVLQDGELLLIYNVREEATDLWLVGKQHFQMFSLPMTEAQVKEQVEEFRKRGIDRVDTDDNSQALADSLEKDFADFTQASHTLYQQLFPATVRTLLGEAKPKRLYIVPTSALYELPFEALVTENTDKPHYLLQDYAISYLSSASLLKTLRDAKQRRGTAQRQPLLAFADPVYPTQDCQSKNDSPLAQQVRDYYALLIGGGLDEESGCPKKLPSEAQSIIKALKLEEDSEPPFLIRGNDASRQTLLTMNSKEQLEGSKYVVFSTHGLVPNKITPLMQPALLLSHTTPLEQEKDEDGEMVLKGFLTMSDVFRLKMNADLVMLSACNTGRGETIKGEGTIGLTRAFMYAGTPAVSITLWSIEAWAAQKLNVAWFTRLKAGQPLADSLREAKLEMLDKSGYYRYPYAWAGVVVFGDGK